MNAFDIAQLQRHETDGNFARLEIPSLLMRPVHQKLTGALKIVQGSTVRMIGFANGAPTVAASSLADERLGPLLQARGAIAPDQLAKVDEIMRTEGLQFGAAAIKFGVLSKQDLAHWLKEQHAHVITQSLGAESVRASFGPLGKLAASRSGLQLLAAIEAGVRAYPHELRETITEKIEGVRFVLQPGVLETAIELGCSASLAQLLKTQGAEAHSFQDYLASSEDDDPAVPILTLILTGIAAPVGTPAAHEAPVAHKPVAAHEQPAQAARAELELPPMPAAPTRPAADVGISLDMADKDAPSKEGAPHDSVARPVANVGDLDALLKARNHSPTQIVHHRHTDAQPPDLLDSPAPPTPPAPPAPPAPTAMPPATPPTPASVPVPAPPAPGSAGDDGLSIPAATAAIAPPARAHAPHAPQAPVQATPAADSRRAAAATPRVPVAPPPSALAPSTMATMASTPSLNSPITPEPPRAGRTKEVVATIEHARPRPIAGLIALVALLMILSALGGAFGAVWILRNRALGLDAATVARIVTPAGATAAPASAFDEAINAPQPTATAMVAVAGAEPGKPAEGAKPTAPAKAPEAAKPGEAKPQEPPPASPTPTAQPSAGAEPTTAAPSATPGKPEPKTPEKGIKKPGGKHGGEMAKGEQPAPPKPEPAPKPAEGAAAAGGGVKEEVAAKLATVRTLLQQGDFRKVLTTCTEILALEPRNAMAYRSLGIAYSSLGAAPQACEAYRRYLRFAPNAQDKPQIEELLAACK